MNSIKTERFAGVYMENFDEKYRFNLFYTSHFGFDETLITQS